MIKGLTLYNPWAFLWALGRKRCETRPWKTSYRGPVLVHVSKKYTGAMHEYSEDPFFHLELSQKKEYYIDLGDLKQQAGHIIGVVDLFDCMEFTTAHKTANGLAEKLYPFAHGQVLESCLKREYTFGNMPHGRFGLLTRNARVLTKPIPWRGALGLWNAPFTLEDYGTPGNAPTVFRLKNDETGEGHELRAAA